MVGVLVRALELTDVDNDLDLDVLVSCKRCGGGSLFRNDGEGSFEDDPRALPAYTNHYDYEPMDVNGDGFLDLVTVNDGPIVGGKRSSRREHIFINDGTGSFVDRTFELWPDGENLGEDDNMVAFLDVDSDGDADFLLGSLTGADRLHLNDGSGRFTVKTDVLGGEPTPGTLALAVADLNGDGRPDVVQAQGEHRTAVQEKVYFGTGSRSGARPEDPGHASRLSRDRRPRDLQCRRAVDTHDLVRRVSLFLPIFRRKRGMSACARPTPKEIVVALDRAPGDNRGPSREKPIGDCGEGAGVGETRLVFGRRFRSDCRCGARRRGRGALRVPHPPRARGELLRLPHGAGAR